MTTTRKEREKQQRKRAILDAALSVFLRKGYEDTTMGEVAKESELSKGTLYLYFESKFDLFAALSSKVLSELAEGFGEIEGRGLSGAETVREMLRRWFTVTSNNLAQFRLAMSWVTAGSHKDEEFDCPGACAHRDSVHDILGRLAAAIARGKEDGSITNTEPEPRLACQLWAAMMGGQLFSRHVDDLGERAPVPITPDAFMESMIGLLCRGIGAKL